MYNIIYCIIINIVYISIMVDTWHPTTWIIYLISLIICMCVGCNALKMIRSEIHVISFYKIKQKTAFLC